MIADELTDVVQRQGQCAEAEAVVQPALDVIRRKAVDDRGAIFTAESVLAPALGTWPE